MSISSITKSILNDRIKEIDKEIKRLEEDNKPLEKQMNEFLILVNNNLNRITDLQANKAEITDDIKNSR